LYIKEDDRNIKAETKLELRAADILVHFDLSRHMTPEPVVSEGNSHDPDEGRHVTGEHIARVVNPQINSRDADEQNQADRHHPADEPHGQTSQARACDDGERAVEAERVERMPAGKAI
jgi:hypothetical protein